MKWDNGACGFKTPNGVSCLLANKLFQIERNSRRLNRATWNISLQSFSQLQMGKKAPLAIVWCTATSFSSSAINSGVWITAAFLVGWSQCFWPHRKHTFHDSSCLQVKSFSDVWGRHHEAAVLISTACCCSNIQVDVWTWKSIFIVCEGWTLTGAPHDQLKY